MIYNFNLTYLEGISGGDRCMFEVVKYLVKHNIENTVITTIRGKKQFTAMGLKETSCCRYITVEDHYDGRPGIRIFIAYLKRTIEANKLLKEVSLCKNDVLFSHNEFIPNILTIKLLAKRASEVKLVYWSHAPDLWKAFTPLNSGYNFNPLNLLYHLLSHLLFRICVSRDSLILLNNAYYEKIVRCWFQKNEICNIDEYSGVDVSTSTKINKKYDLVWCGRFQHIKGVNEIIDIVEKCKDAKPHIKVAIIGSGGRWGKKLQKDISKRGLIRNVMLLGFLDGEEKYKIIKSSKLFLMTSYYESFGQVNLEAMKCGLPIVAYDLPSFKLYNRGMIRVPIRNNQKMAKEIIKLINNENYYKYMSKEALQFSKNFSWEKTGEKVFQELHKLIGLQQVKRKDAR